MKDYSEKAVINKEAYDAVIFDLDGVLTRTAKVHSAAWKELFDGYLKGYSAEHGEEFIPFDEVSDYRKYVDGMPRSDGVKKFLESRGINLPMGAPEDSVDEDTIWGLANRKNKAFLKKLEEKGVEVYEATVRWIQILRSNGFKTAIISSSRNCGLVLKKARLDDLFDVKVDGMDAAQIGFAGKPAPDIFLEAARRLGVTPSRTVIVEDAISGVEAGRKGNVGLVVGIDRGEHRDELLAHGADIVVSEANEIPVEKVFPNMENESGELESALDHIDSIIDGNTDRISVFLDYDGTLTPIVDRPDMAVMSDSMRERVHKLLEVCFVAIVSGRGLEDVRRLVGLEDLTYAGSHGFEISSPRAAAPDQLGVEYIPDVEKAEAKLRERLSEINGAIIERKKFSVAVHYRLVDESELQLVENTVDEVVAEFRKLRKSSGKKVFELQPDIEWHKGKALELLMNSLGLKENGVFPIYIGDDITDEDAFKAIRDIGVGIIVRGESRSTAAHYALESTEEVGRFLDGLADSIWNEER
ncbi:MAG: trehalose-phosphatase [Verrucomicrobia bacterium]|nr:trehalose-phosphatase [Verrucomicrobiota bacterium]